MVSNPLIPLDLQPVKERILVEISRVRGLSPNLPSIQQMESHFNKAARISNKANALARAISRSAEKYFIPVNPNAIEVRAAVQRRSADSTDGLKISFDLFKDGVEAAQKERQALEKEVALSGQTEPASVVEKRIRKIRARVSLEMSGDDPDDDLLEMLISQFIILYLAHELMKPFEGMLDHLPLSQTWQEKQEGGSETQIVVSVLIGLAIQMLIMNINEDIMETYLDEAAGGNLPNGFTSKSIIQAAKGLERTKGMELAQKHAGLNDYEIILRYAFEYLERTTEPGYDFWVAYVDAVNMRYTAQSMWVYAPFYSVPHALHATNKKKGNKNQPKEEDLDKRRDLFLEKAVVQGLFPMANGTYLAKEDALDKMDDSLNVIAQVLSSEFAMELACCLGRLLGGVPTSALRDMRSLLYGLLRAYAIDVGNMIQAIYAHLTSPNFAEIIALEAMHQVDKIFNDIIEHVLGIFDDKVEALLCCPFVGELIRAIFQIINRLEAELKGAIKIFADQLVQSLGIGFNPIQRRYELQYDTRIIRKIIMILDSVIRAAEVMKNCDKDSVHGILPDTVRRSIELPTIDFEDPEKNYFTNVLPKEFESGKFLPGLGDKVRNIVTTAAADAEDRMNGKKKFCAEVDDKVFSDSAKAFGSA